MLIRYDHQKAKVIFKKLLGRRETWLLGILIVICFVFTFINSNFISLSNLSDMFRINSMLFIIAQGMLFIIITGGMDFSASAIVMAVSYIDSYCIVHWGLGIGITIIISIIIGICLGIANGLLVGKVKVPAIIATLGTGSMIKGLMLWITNGENIKTAVFPQWFKEIALLKVFGIPIQIFIAILTFLLSWYILKHTFIGKAIYAIGGSDISAKRIGIRNDRVLFFVYGFMGFLIGIATLNHLTIVITHDPNAYKGIEIQIIGGVLIGGASISGGYGTMIGMLFGSIFMYVLNNGLVLIHTTSYWQKVIMGVVIIIAAIIDVIQKKSLEKSTYKTIN